MSEKTRIIRSVIMILLGVGMLIAFIYLGQKDYSDDETSSKNFHDEYSSVEKNNVFVYKSAKEALELLKNKTGVVFMGFASCPWCQAYAPILNEVAKEKGISVIYYVDIKKDREDNTAEYQEIVSLLGKYLDANDAGDKRIFVPNVTFVKEGTIVGNNNETSRETGVDINGYWTETAKSALKNILYQEFSKILDCATCNN